jgi:type IV pilus assembly protein PilW
MQGFGMVEMMIALLISLVLIGGTSQIFLSAKKSFTIQNSLSRQQENGRYAINVMTADLRRAGYWGGNAQVEDIGGNLGSLDDNGTCPDNTTWGRMIDRRITGLNDTSTGYACIPTTGTTGKYLRGDVLTVRYTASWIVGGTTTPTFDSNRVYMRSDLFRGRIFQGSQEGNPVNAISTPASLSERESELISRAYYVGDSGERCGNGDIIPSLFRQTLGPDGTPIAEEVAYGVDNLQVRYGVDTNGDASIDQYFDAGDANLDSTTEWGQVVAAHLWLMTRAECPESGFNHAGGAYTLGDISYTPADATNFGYRRQLFQSTVQLRNL